MQQLVHWAVLFVMFPVILSGCGDSDERAYTVGWFPPIVDESDCSNGYCLIPAGTFQMGSPDSESDRQGDEGPVHSVTITRSFLMRQTEVTQIEWESLMGNNPSYFRSCGDRCPVEGVNWYDAVSYANALSKSEGFETCYTIENCSGTAGNDLDDCTVTFKGLGCTGYRLPTEAEWEYAARAGGTYSRYSGPVSWIAWYYANSDYTTHPIAQKAPNAWGLYDMLGNVWEWVNDRYDASYYSACSSGCADPTGPSTGSARVYRGGSCYSYAWLVRAALRGNNSPGGRFGSLGFRVARSVP